tara:strand:- start:41 stop:739 length:699 start_codon:yes stop_codon:yes gene_type:complete
MNKAIIKMLKITKKFNKFTWTIIPFVIFSSFVSASETLPSDFFYNNDMCAENYERLSSVSLQFLYQLDGNLDNVNASKKKRIAYLDDVFKSDDKPMESRRRAYNELFSDPDYWETGVKDKAQALIVDFERVVRSHDWESYKKKVNNKRLYFSFQKIKEVDALYSKALDFLSHLGVTEIELEKLGYDLYFQNATKMDSFRFALSKGAIQTLLRSIKSCQLGHLEYDLLKNYAK